MGFPGSEPVAGGDLLGGIEMCELVELMAVVHECLTESRTPLVVVHSTCKCIREDWGVEAYQHHLCDQLLEWPATTVSLPQPHGRAGRADIPARRLAGAAEERVAAFPAPQHAREQVASRRAAPTHGLLGHAREDSAALCLADDAPPPRLADHLASGARVDPQCVRS